LLSFSRSLFAALAISLMAAGNAYAQSAEPEAEEPATQEDSSQKTTAEKKKAELSDDQRELDKQLLGSWALVTGDSEAELTDVLFRKAVASCGAVPFATGLDVEPGLKNALPDRKQIRGHLVYFRTDQGLQRYEANPSRVFLLPDIRKAVNAQGRTIWQVSGRFAKFSLTFAGSSRSIGAFLMLEENRLFLKCENPPQPDG